MSSNYIRNSHYGGSSGSSSGPFLQQDNSSHSSWSSSSSKSSWSSSSSQSSARPSVFGITEARQLNYTGPQGEGAVPATYSSGNSGSKSKLDWSGLVDKVFKEEIDKLAQGYHSGQF